jgi:hypothetical protein
VLVGAALELVARRAWLVERHRQETLLVEQFQSRVALDKGRKLAVPWRSLVVLPVRRVRVAQPQ